MFNGGNVSSNSGCSYEIKHKKAYSVSTEDEEEFIKSYLENKTTSIYKLKRFHKPTNF